MKCPAGHEWIYFISSTTKGRAFQDCIAIISSAKHISIKREEQVTQYLFFYVYVFEEIKVENLRFSPFYLSFLFYLRFRPLDVCLYAFGTKNEDFCAGSVRPWLPPPGITE